MAYGENRVAVLGLGGTIATVPSADGTAVPALSPTELVSVVPGLAELGVTLETAEVRRLPSPSLGFADIEAVLAAARERIADGCVGVVVTQGTDSIEEVAYALDLRYDRPEPIVVTGAMRFPTEAGADGPANLLAAVSVAASLHARELGVLVTLADEIHAARYVRKTHPTSLTTFQSPDAGPLGYLVEGEPRLLGRIPARMVLPAARRATSPRVCLLQISLDDDGYLLDRIDKHVDGVVVAAFGGGNVPAALVPRLTELAETIPIVLSSRVGAGTVLAATYSYPGSAQDLLKQGLINAGFLHPIKARILLRGLLCVDADHDDIAAAFTAAGGCGNTAAWPWPQTATDALEH